MKYPVPSARVRCLKFSAPPEKTLEFVLTGIESTEHQEFPSFKMNNHDIAKQYVQYNSQLKAVICIQHKYALTLKNPSNEQSEVICHFQNIHTPGLSKDIIDMINEYISTLDLVKSSQITIPRRENGPIDGLELYEDGCKCLTCGEFAINSHAMRTHYSKKHKLNAIDGIRWIKQPIQTIFQGSNRQYTCNFHILIIDIFLLISRWTFLPLQSRSG